MMIDAATRFALAAGALTVLLRSLWLLRNGVIVTYSRRVSLTVIAFAAVPSVAFWLYLLFTSPVVDGALRFDAYLSRLAAAWTLIALYTLTELITASEKGRRNGRLPD